MAKNREDHADEDGDWDEEVEEGEFEEDEDDQSDQADEGEEEEAAEGEEDEDDVKIVAARLPEEVIHVFEQTEAQLEGFYEEIGIISKRKPDDAINKFKLGFINQMLQRANTLLGEKYRPFPDFEIFDPDAMPTASDVVTMLAQYLRSMDKFRKDHTYLTSLGDCLWRVSGSPRKIWAKAPKDFE
jgi:hypothetical protein